MESSVSDTNVTFNLPIHDHNSTVTEQHTTVGERLTSQINSTSVAMTTQVTTKNVMTSQAESVTPQVTKIANTFTSQNYLFTSMQPSTEEDTTTIAAYNPPYVLVTNSTVAVPPDPQGLSAGAIAAIVVSIIVLLVILLVVILLVILYRRRRLRKRGNIRKVENPHYATSMPSNYRFSRDSALYVGPTVNFQKLNNNVSDDASPAKKTKRSAPTVPTNKKKGPAPPPPNPFGAIEESGESDHETSPLRDNMYEKDSNVSSEDLEMSTFAVKNDASYISNHNTPQLARAQSIASHHSNDSDNEVQTDNQKEALISEKSGSRGNVSKSGSQGNVSDDVQLDDYDKALNPFFSS